VAESIATAYVSIKPNLDGFREELRSGLEEATSGLDAKVRIDADTTEADVKIDETRGKLDELGAETARPRVEVDPESAEGQLQAFRDSFDEVGAKTADPTIRVDDTDAQVKLAELRAEIDELQTKAATIKIGTSGQARKDITDLQAALDSLSNETLRPKVDDRDLQRLQGDLDGLDSKLQSVGADADKAGASLGGGGAAGGGGGLLGSVLPLIPALGTVGAVGASGLIGLVNAASAAGLGLGAFALAAEGDLATVGNQIHGLLTNWQLATAAFVDPVIVNAVSLLPSVFQFLTPSVASASLALQGLEQNMSASLGSPYLRQFSQFIAGEGGAAITSFGHLLGGLGHAWSGFAEGFAPELQTIDADLVRWGQDLTKWGNEAANGGFSSFLNYIQANGPLVAHTVEDLGATFVTIAKDAAPLGPVTLKIVDAAASLLNLLLQVNPTLTTWGLGLAAVAFEANKLLGVVGVGGLAGAAKALPGLFSSIGDAAAIGATGVYSVATAATGSAAALTLVGAAGTGLEGGLIGVVYGLLNAVGAFGSFTAAADASGQSWAKNFIAQLPAGTDKVAAVNTQLSSLGAQLGDVAQRTHDGAYAMGVLSTAAANIPIGQLSGQFKTLGQSLIADGYTPAQSLTTQYDNLTATLEHLQGQQKGLQALLPGLKQAQDAQTAAIDASATATGAAAGYTGSYALEYGLLTSQLNTANQALTQTETLLNNMVSANLTAEQATTTFYAAIQTLTTSLHTNGTSLDVTTAKGLANRQAFDQVAAAINSTIQSLEHQGATSDQVVGKVSSLTSYIEQQAGKYGLTKGQVDAYLHSLGLTPAQVKTDLLLAGYDTAAANLRGLQNQIAALPKSTTLYVNTVLTTSIPGHPGKGAAPGAATGMGSSPGGWTHIGEAGSEAVIVPGGGASIVKDKSLAYLPTGTQVLSHPDTRKAFPGLAGGDTTVSQLSVPAVVITLNDQRQVVIGDLASKADVVAALNADRTATIAAIRQLIPA
jgi:hypothetical protein